MPAVEAELHCPSGVLVVTDFGYLGGWSGESEPPERTTVVTDHGLIDTPRLADYRVVGPGVGEEMPGSQVRAAPFLYDVPVERADEFRLGLAERARQWRISIVREPSRVPHRVRAQRAAELGGGVFQVHGVPSVAVPVPSTSRVRIRCNPAEVKEVGRMWWSAEATWKQATAGAPVGKIGFVGVDWARLMFVDAHALSSWRHEESRDGLADVVFWGRDAKHVAATWEAESTSEPGVYGWVGLPLDEAIAVVQDLTAQTNSTGHRVATDFRPHSDHYLMMAQLRGDEFALGSVDLDGSTAISLTTWGDGMFPVAWLDDLQSGEMGIGVRLGVTGRLA